MLPRKEDGSFLVKIERWFNCTVAASFSFAVGTFSLISFAWKEESANLSRTGPWATIAEGCTFSNVSHEPRASLFDHFQMADDQPSLLVFAISF